MNRRNWIKRITFGVLGLLGFGTVKGAGAPTTEYGIAGRLDGIVFNGGEAPWLTPEMLDAMAVDVHAIEIIGDDEICFYATVRQYGAAGGLSNVSRRCGKISRKITKEKSKRDPSKPVTLYVLDDCEDFELGLKES